jgi:cytochrome c oxidase subunit 2
MGPILALIIWLISLATVVVFAGHYWWFPELISEQGKAIDRQFAVTFAIVGIAFFLAQLGLGYCLWRYREGRSGQVTYTHGSSRLEILWTILTAGVFISLAVSGQRVWAELHLTPPPADAVQIEVTGQQFAWNIRYPGPDGIFGRTDPKWVDDTGGNALGLDDKDPAAKDDIVTVNQMAVPVDRPVRVVLRSKDVTHSFFVPWMRFKQDAVPGMGIMVHFTANKTGKYEIVCAELCGMLHWQMRGFLTVMSDQDFQNWLKQHASQ